MKRLPTTVDSCRECPFRKYEGYSHYNGHIYECVIEPWNRPIDGLATLPEYDYPDWCPLPDIEEED